jgi:serine/threonine protein kinase
MASKKHVPGVLAAGTIFDGRFVVAGQVERGGSATIHRAEDRTTGRTVALKVLHRRTIHGQETTRLLQEAKILAELCHLRIVPYVGHGVTAQGEPYLAMEWMEGENLAQRLRREPLAFGEVMSLFRGVAEGLSVTHGRNIIHRDIKPSNLFLRDKKVENLVIIDFGVALNQEHGLLITADGALVGTPGYMSPEQAKGIRDIDPRADLFSLGCIVHECLTGKPTFFARHLSALLAQILFREVPPVHTLRPDVPEGLSELIARMLSKDSRLRPANGAQLCAELDALRRASASGPASGPATDTASGSASVSVPRPQAPSPLLFREEYPLWGFVVSSQHPTQIMSYQTLDDLEPDPMFLAGQQELACDLSRLGIHVEQLYDKTVVASFPLTASTARQLPKLIAYLKDAQNLYPHRTVVVGTSESEKSGDAALGDRLERAFYLFASIARPGKDSSPGTQDLHGLFLGYGVTSLLGSMFDTERVHSRLFRVCCEQEEQARVHKAALIPKRMLGRDNELSFLLETLRNGQKESSARVIEVMGNSGIGKSRLLAEFLAQVNVAHKAWTILSARGTPFPTEHPTPMLANAVRSLGGPTQTTGLSDLKELPYKRLRLNSRPLDASRLFAPLYALCGLLSSASATAQAPTAEYLDELSAAFVCFLSAESEAGPVLFVLDDVQFADAASMQILERALADLADRPIFVVSASDLSLSARFPSLWSHSPKQTLSLAPLDLGTTEELVLEFSEGQLSPQQTHRIGFLSQGHPKDVCELVLWMLDRNRDPFPRSIAIPIRIDALHLPKDARLVLRAASTIGVVFWDEAVRRVLLETRSSERVAQMLNVLCEQEWIIRQPDSQYPGCQEYRFARPLVQECFASFLSPEEHQLVAERSGEFLHRQSGS